MKTMVAALMIVTVMMRRGGFRRMIGGRRWSFGGLAGRRCRGLGTSDNCGRNQNGENNCGS